MSNLSNPIRVLPDFLPGRLILCRGSSHDYRTLEPFHYVCARPATWAGVWTIRYVHSTDGKKRATRGVAAINRFRIVAVGVLSYPTLNCFTRERALKLESLTRRERIDWVNQNLRTISRVVVHPQFRCLGLSSFLIRWMCEHCDTRYVEALARMGRGHPLFERAGMKRFDPGDKDEPVYYLHDRASPVSRDAQRSAR